MNQYISKSALVAEIEKKIKQYEMAFDSPSFASYEATLIAKGKYRKLLDILQFIDTLEVKEVQEEPVSRTPADIEAAMQEVEEKSRAFTEAHQGENTDTILAQMRGEEPVSEDLEEAADNALSNVLNIHEIVNIRSCLEMFRYGAKWQKANLWKPADGDDLPEIDKEVIVLVGIKNPVTTDSMWGCEVAFAHRPNPDGWDGKSITTGKVEHYDVQTYDKGGWNIPDVKYWLDCELPKMEE